MTIVFKGIDILKTIAPLTKYLFTFLLFALFSSKLLAAHSEILVGLEPFPPLVNEDGSGYVINMLSALQQQTELDFNFQMMTYARAKKELKSHRIDIIGLTPKDSETQEFYQYAQELSWHFDTTVDFYTTSPSNFDFDSLPNKSIGTLIGNADFFSELSVIPRDKFIEVSSLTQLIMMMARGRLKIVLFERVAMMSTISQLQNELSNKIPSELNSIEKPQKIYYQKFKTIAASLAVAKTAEAEQLKLQLNNLLSKGTEKYFKTIAPYAQLPDKGVIE